MKRSPILNPVAVDLVPTLELDGISFTIAKKGNSDNYFMGDQGCVVHVHDPANKGVLVVGSEDGVKLVHKCGVRTDSPRQVLVETLKTVAKLQGLTSWRGVPSASIISDWVDESLGRGEKL